MSGVESRIVSPCATAGANPDKDASQISTEGMFALTGECFGRQKVKVFSCWVSVVPVPVSGR